MSAMTLQAELVMTNLPVTFVTPTMELVVVVLLMAFFRFSGMCLTEWLVEDD